MKGLRLSGNQLKLLALFAMTCDHVAVQLLPQQTWLRIIGRLALPIYGYMIAEGCRYTRSRARYLGSLLAVAAVCQGVYFFAMGSLYQCILVTFSLSIGLIYLWEWAKDKFWGAVPVAVAVSLIWFLCEKPVLPGTDFAIDYGIFGVLLPVLIYMGKDRRQRLWLTGLGLLLLGLDRGGIQWLALLALFLLALYDGSRGKWKLKYLFYIYYPAHLAVIWLISQGF